MSEGGEGRGGEGRGGEGRGGEGRGIENGERRGREGGRGEEKEGQLYVLFKASIIPRMPRKWVGGLTLVVCWS